ncbi:MAG TPA: DUF3368 domain-containing protein [Thermoanaerobaculia bacterium]
MNLLEAAGRIVIPPAVHAELIGYDLFWDEDRPAWIGIEKLTPQSSEMTARWLQAGLLDPGEAEALSLAIQLQADWFLTDDSAARLITLQQGLEVHGSLGVVLWAAATGHLDHSAAEGALEALSGSSLWISSRILEEARAALRQIFA